MRSTVEKVKDALLNRQKVTHRPDLAAHNFHVKLPAVITYIINEDVFEEVESRVCVIELQKRSLPHAYYIFFLSYSSKLALLKQNKVDCIISAKILSSNNQALRDLILKHKVHDWCGIFTSSPAYLIDGA